MSLRLHRIRPDAAAWRADDADRPLHQTWEWVAFVAATQGAEAVFAEVRDPAAGDRVVGSFVGLLVRRLGLRILGSPFPGWTTPWMGFTLCPGVDRGAAVRALLDLAAELRCVHVELADRALTDVDVAALEDTGADIGVGTTLEVDLRGTEDDVLARMQGSKRRAIKKAERSGLSVRAVAGDGVQEGPDGSWEDFAALYHEQLRGVFARQSLVPTYGVDRVRALVGHLESTGRLLLVRVDDAGGRPVATGIFPGHGSTSYFWGGASVREASTQRPNEAMFWFAFRHWQARGVAAMDMGGTNDYKRPYGAHDVRVPTVARSRPRVVSSLRDVARRAVGARQRLRGRRSA